MKKLTIPLILIPLLLITFVQAQVSVYFSPNGGCKNAVINEINNARSQILVAIYTFTDEDIAQSLVKAKNKGINIQVLMDKVQASGNYSKDELLINNGIPVKYSTGQGLMHNKFAVIDTLIVITGSFNWTFAAENKNAENLLVIKSAELAKQYLKEFLRLWESGTSISQDKIETETKAKTGNYIGNSNSMKFHKADCAWAQKISPANRVYFKTREEAIKAGYQPCKVCKP